MIKDVRRKLQAAGIENPDLEARWILKQVLGVSDADLIAGTIPQPTPAQAGQVESILTRRAAGEPLSRIFGEREFWGLKFKVTPATLDPRPDTETLIEAVLEKFHVKQEPLKILDLGTGTGCILITLLHEYPEATGVGIDISPEALEIASHNAKELGVPSRARFLLGNWAADLNEQFDLVVSNPPYIASAVIPNLRPEVRNHDPILALDGGEDGLQAYKMIFSSLPKLLKKDGKAFLEIGFDQEVAIQRLGEKYRIRIERVVRDIAGQPRVVEISCGDK